MPRSLFHAPLWVRNVAATDVAAFVDPSFDFLPQGTDFLVNGIDLLLNALDIAPHILDVFLRG